MDELAKGSEDMLTSLSHMDDEASGQTTEGESRVRYGIMIKKERSLN